MKTLVLTFFLTFASAQALAQSPRIIFEEGKALFDAKQYALALVKLEPLTSLQEDDDLVRYASYYYAVSAYHSSDTERARSMFLQISQRYPNWKQLNEVYYWLGLLAFEEKDPQLAINHLNKIKDSSMAAEVRSLKKVHFKQIKDIDTLKQLLEDNPEESLVASRLVDEVVKLDIVEQDIDFLEELAEYHDLELEILPGGVVDSPKKEVYNVGLFLPFIYYEDSVRLEQIQRHWTLRLYEGFNLGVEKLKEEGIKVNLLTFDTRDPELPLSEILASQEVKELDLIVGPLTEEAVLEVADFAKEQQINMLNPLSSSDQIIKGNPFAFLYYPSNKSIARAAANYAKKVYRHNFNAAVFYSGSTDKPRAQFYKDILEKDSFKVTIFKQIQVNETTTIQNMFLEKGKREKDSTTVVSMMAEMDSLREAGIQNWQIYEEDDFLEESLSVAEDSIGHIFVASDLSPLSSSTISAIDAREDDIGFIGSSKYLSYEQGISFEQLERINAVFTGTNWVDFSTDEVSEFRERYESTYHAYPVKLARLGDSYIGYDIMVTYGRLLHQYGKYFQIGLKQKAGILGEISGKFDYRFSNDNRAIPIFRITNSQVVPVENTKTNNAQN